MIQPSFATSTQDNVGSKLPKLSVDYVVNAPASTYGKPMIVEFWATWCGPCVKNIPHLNELSEKYSGRGLIVIGVTKESPSKVKSFMQNNPMRYSVAVDARGALSKNFGIRGIPHALLVNRAGKIIWEGHPSHLKDKDIEEALASDPPTARPLPKVL